MGDLDARELAQLGLKHIEDAAVGLLVRHPKGLSAEAISEQLGLGEGLAAGHRDMVATAILEWLVASGRIFRDERSRIYLDNPNKI
jgi:hypothetical protein